MNQYHNLLTKQIMEHFGKKNIADDFPKEMEDFLNTINKTYIERDKEKEALEENTAKCCREYDDNLEKLKKQLIHQEKMASIGQLSAGIMHEINNPLGFVQSNTETLKKYINKMGALYELLVDINNSADYIKPEGYEGYRIKLMEFIKQNKIDLIYSDLDTIFEETSEGLRRVENIIKSLLGFCRKEDENEFVEYDINKGIKDTLIVAKNEIKYFAQVTEVLNPVPLIMGIHGEINQVLLNIIVNAAHAIREKELMGTIEINTYSEEGFVCCEISDNGTGIKEENIKRIFEPFFTTKPEGMGTGLGLSIAYDIIVNKHKGYIEVDSEAGKGTTFRLKLPEKQGV